MHRGETETKGGKEKVALGDKANRHLDPGVSDVQVKLSPMTKSIY